MQHAAVLQQLGRASTALAQAGTTLAVERGLGTGLLANPSAATTSLREAIAARRAAAAAYLRVSEDTIAQIKGLDQQRLTALRDALHAATARVDALRSQVAGTDSGTMPAPAVWFTAITSQIEAVTALRRLIDSVGNSEDGITRLIAVRDALSDMAEFSGRERGQVNGMIAANAHLTPPLLLEMGVLHGRVEAAWQRIRPRIDALPPATAEAVRAAGTATFDVFAAQRARVFSAVTAGEPWPVSAQEWFASATAAIDSMIAAQASAAEALGQVTRQHTVDSQHNLSVTLTILAVGLGVCLVTGWYVKRRVVRPLDRAIRTLDALTEGKLDVTIPDARGRDEVARLLLATRRFHQSLLAYRELENLQQAAQQKAQHERVQAVQDVGALIERETAEVVTDVVALTDRLTSVCQELSRDAGAIVVAAGTASSTATEGRNETDSAATGARGLSEAIAEVAQQMERAATTTRGVVARTAETRESFEALFRSVNEVQEVTRLIGDIAGQTNMLALNATIEAARAGESGKGFAVVATEVKNLASQTSRSTEQIAGRVEAIAAAARHAQGTLDGIVQAVGALDAISTQVSAAVEEQSAATKQIALAVEGASVAAHRTETEATGIASLAARCQTGVDSSREITDRAAKQTAALQGALTRILRSRVAELNRRTSARTAVRLPARLIHAGGTVAGELSDISQGGARLTGSIPAISQGRLLVEGFPQIPVQVVGRTADAVNLAFVLEAQADRDAVAQVIGRMMSADEPVLAA